MLLRFKEALEKETDMSYEQASECDSNKLDTIIKNVLVSKPMVVIALAKEQGCDITAKDFWPTVHVGLVLALFAIRAGDINMSEVNEILGD